MLLLVYIASVCLHACLSVCLCVCVCLSVCLSVRPSVCLSFRLYACLSVTVWLICCVYLLTCRSERLYDCLSVCLSFCHMWFICCVCSHAGLRYSFQRLFRASWFTHSKRSIEFVTRGFFTACGCERTMLVKEGIYQSFDFTSAISIADFSHWEVIDTVISTSIKAHHSISSPQFCFYPCPDTAGNFRFYQLISDRSQLKVGLNWSWVSNEYHPFLSVSNCIYKMC